MENVITYHDMFDAPKRHTEFLNTIKIIQQNHVFPANNQLFHKSSSKFFFFIKKWREKSKKCLKMLLNKQ